MSDADLDRIRDIVVNVIKPVKEKVEETRRMVLFCGIISAGVITWTELRALLGKVNKLGKKLDKVEDSIATLEKKLDRIQTTMLRWIEQPCGR